MIRKSILMDSVNNVGLLANRYYALYYLYEKTFDTIFPHTHITGKFYDDYYYTERVINYEMFKQH